MKNKSTPEATRRPSAQTDSSANNGAVQYQPSRVKAPELQPRLSVTKPINPDPVEYNVKYVCIGGAGQTCRLTLNYDQKDSRSLEAKKLTEQPDIGYAASWEVTVKNGQEPKSAMVESYEGDRLVGRGY